MRKADTKVVGLVLGSAAVIVFLQWLRQDPRCDRGCQTQLEHLQEHVFDNLVRGFFA